ncbi:putative ribonuclease H-like domain-containing protein [Tanacetum coccineum]
MGHFARECRAPRNKEGQFGNQDNTRKHGKNEDTSSKAMLAIDGVDSEVYNDKTCSKTCLKNYETLKKQCDDLIVKLNQTEFTTATYKRGLATVEEQLIIYRKNEVFFSEEVAVLKREVACKDYEINVLKSEFEKVKQEKEGIKFKIEKFDKASKDLDKLLGSKITDKSKKGFGNSKTLNSKVTTKSLTLFVIKEQVSEDTSSFVESPLNVDKETIFLDKKIEIVKPKNHEKTIKKSVRHMTGSIAYLLDFKEFDGGYVTFGGGAYGGRISGKGKQHRASYKSKVLNPITKPLFMLHMDLFGLTFKEDISQDCIVMPIWKDASYFDLPSKDVGNGEPKSVVDYQKHDEDGPHNESDEKDKCIDKDEPKVDLGNILNSYTVPTTPNIRIHKDHPIKNVIGDVKSSVQTRRMTKPTSEQGFLSAVYKEKTHDTLNTYLPNRKRAIGTKWVFRNKKDERGIVIRNKARVHSYIPRAWYKTLANYLLGNGFKRGKIDQTLFIKKQKGDILLVQVYVDDIIFGSTNKELCTAFEKLMKDKFQMSSMGELTFFLGLQVTQKEDGIFISQDKYVAEILKKFNYTDVKSASTPVDLEKPLVKDGDADDVDVHLYRSMIGSLMYLTASRPDIMFAVCACARFQVTPKTSHLLAVKRIFRYLKGKPTLGLWYSRDSPFELVAYTDSDYAVHLDRKFLTKGFDARRHVKRGRDTKIPQFSGPPVKVSDEAVHKELGDRMERVATTASRLEAEQDNDAQTRFENYQLKTVINDSTSSQEFKHLKWEDNMKTMELMAHCTNTI